MIRRVSVALAAGLFVVAFPLAAGAHVEIEADGAPTDGVVVTSIAAENECADNGKLESVELLFPESPELTTATAGTVDGWTAAVTKKAGSEAVEKVVWTNTGQVEGDGEYTLTIGTVSADEQQLAFKAIDTCDDGKITRWVEAGESSEFPAPVLALAASTAETPSTSKVEVTTKDSSDDSNTTAVVIAVIAGVVVIGGIAFAISRRRS